MPKEVRLFLMMTVFWSFCSCNQSTAPSDKKAPNKSRNTVDTNNVSEELIEELLHNKNLNSDSLLLYFNPELKKLSSSYSHQFSITEYEFVLYFEAKDKRLADSYIFILEEQKAGYRIIDHLSLNKDSEYEPEFDSRNKLLFHKTRINGTCDEGYYISVYKLIDDRLKKVVTLHGNHEGSSCGSYTDEDDDNKDFEYYSKVESDYEIMNQNAIINTCKLSHWKFDQYMDTWTEKIITDKEIKLYYTYNPDLKKFICFNSNKMKIFQEGMSGLSFELVDLIKKGML